LREIVGLIPDEWLGEKGEALNTAIVELAAIILRVLTVRLERAAAFVKRRI